MRNRVRRSTLPLCASVTAALLAGCGSNADEAGGSGAAVTMGITDEVTSVDPAAGYDPASWIVFNNVFQSLLSFPKGGTSPEPDAAEKCGFTDSVAQVYECTLHEGLTFSNGNPLTSEDVKYSFDRTLRINDDAGPAVMLASIDTIETPDDRTVVFRLKHPDATFPMKIASGAGSIVDHREYPADRLREDGKAVGSGVYKLDSFDPERRAVFSVNDTYQGAAAPARNPGVTMRFYNSQSDLRKAVEDGSVDLAYRGLAIDDLAAMEETSSATDNGLKVVEGSGAEVQHLVFNLKDPVVGDKAVRQAIAYLIDRQALIRDVYKRTADPLYSIIPAGITGHNTAFFDLYGERPDKAKARQTLQAAGYTGKVAFTLWSTPVRYGPGTQASLELLAKQLNSSDLFDVTVKSAEADEYAGNIEAGKYAVYVKGWVPDYPDPDNFTAPFFGDGNVLYNHYKNPRITDVLLPRTAAEATRVSTVADFESLQDEVATDVPIIPLWQGKQHVVAKDSINGLEWTLDASTVFRFWEIQKFEG